MSFRYLRLDKIYYKLDKVWLLYECVYYGKMKAVKGGGCMEHITVGRKNNTSTVALVECVKNGSLNNIDIKGKCFLLIILTKGKLEFKVWSVIL